MQKIAPGIVMVFVIVGFISMVLCLNSIGLSSEYGRESDMAKTVAYIIGISVFELGVAAAITMVISFALASLIHKKFGQSFPPFPPQ